MPSSNPERERCERCGRPKYVPGDVIGSAGICHRSVSDRGIFICDRATITRLEAALSAAQVEIAEVRRERDGLQFRIRRQRKGLLIYRRGAVDAGNPEAVKLADLLLSNDPEPVTDAELALSFAGLLAIDDFEQEPGEGKEEE